MSMEPSSIRTADGPPGGGRPAAEARVRLLRRRRLDGLARGIVTMGGMLIILSILAILGVIAGEGLPLFLAPSTLPRPAARAPSTALPLALAVDEYLEVALGVTREGLLFHRFKDGSPIEVPGAKSLPQVASVSRIREGRFVLGTGDGRLIPVEVSFPAQFQEGVRRVSASLKVEPGVDLVLGGRPVGPLAHGKSDSGPVMAAVTGERELTLVTQRRTKALVGPPKVESVLRKFPVPGEGRITALEMDGRAEDLFVGSSLGTLVRVDLRGAEPRAALPILVSSREGSGVTALGFLLGDRSLVVGDAAGGISTWQILRSEEGDPYLARIRSFEGHPAEVTALASSHRDKGFASADAAGGLRVHYGTTGRTQMELALGEKPAALAYGPKGNALVALGVSGTVAAWELKNPHPEVTLQALFGRVPYEGYKEPEFVWQSTGGTDDVEAKLGLAPLIYGTLKGTSYALLIAVPLALLAALHVSQFMHPSLKATVKPVIEVMAALPSVVLGFIAGLWLAPRVEQVVPGIALAPAVLLSLILASLALWRLSPKRWRAGMKAGSEVFLLVPVVLLGFGISLAVGGWVESAFLGGDYRGWIRQVLGVNFDQRNSVVVGIAMGFAVIPIIFTIAEDSLSNVPAHLSAGSLALGATRWQTAVRVILPTASPGIFSAVMIGFGRAVGETMIVLMATGNTPLMSPSPFNGFRALSANIAVELPEAPEGGTLFRVLFLAAFLLFLMTFGVNTAAELVRLRLRRRYQNL
jgi:phosphate transport system permease protein